MPGADAPRDDQPEGRTTDPFRPGSVPTDVEPTGLGPAGADGSTTELFDGSLRSALPWVDGEAVTADAPPVRSVPGFRAPGFEVIEEIGRGGMGIVYKARQVRLNRLVALKALPPALAADPQRLHRFQNEATFAARVTDSRVVTIYDVMEVDGAPVLVMPFVDGCDLARLLADRRAVLRGSSSADRHSTSTLDGRSYHEALLPLLDQLVDAVAAIHNAGILHRDIKPSNVLVDRQGNVFLTDFGLARLGIEAKMTVAGMGLGTYGYMSPEQWEGRTDLDARADLFGLGATIYQALTLELPYGRHRIAANSPPAPPPSRRGGPRSRDLDAVVLKALEPDRRDRYGSIAAFREDWRRVRAGQVPKARRIGPVGRVARQARRNSLAVTFGALLALMAGLLAFAFPTGGGGGNPRLIPSPGDPARIVEIATKPPGARFVVVPIDEDRGIPRADRAVRPGTAVRTPARLRLPPGDYLVVVAWPDGRFHEVPRRVPRPDEPKNAYRRLFWSDLPGGAVGLFPISAPPAGIESSMAFVPGRGGVAPFYLDRTEVTVGQYRRIQPGVPSAMRPYLPTGPEADDYAVRAIDFEHAQSDAEMLGKRLPEHAEYLAAAAVDGRRFPWGDDPAPLRETAWPFGPVGAEAFDVAPAPGRIAGLYSNVAEWTSTWFPPLPQGLAPPAAERWRVVVGGPPSVVRGEPDPAEFDQGARAATLQPSLAAFPLGVGFRCARSARPRFLDPIPGPPQPPEPSSTAKARGVPSTGNQVRTK